MEWLGEEGLVWSGQDPLVTVLEDTPGDRNNMRGTEAGKCSGKGVVGTQGVGKQVYAKKTSKKTGIRSRRA